MSTALVSSQDEEMEAVHWSQSPLLSMLEYMRADNRSLLRDEEKKKDLCTVMWIQTMLDEDNHPTVRLRASENLAKSNGMFVERKELTLLGGYRDMVMNAKGKLVELNPLHKDSTEAMDAMEYVEYEVED